MAEKKQKSKTSENQKVSTGRLKLLVTVVPRAKAEFYADLIQSFDVNLQMLSSAQGTAGVELMDRAGRKIRHHQKRQRHCFHGADDKHYRRACVRIFVRQQKHG